MGKSRSRQKPSLETELQIAFSDRFPDRDLMNKLERVVEEFLPRDFSTWENKHSHWKGDVKTVDGTQRDPGTRASAWTILSAFEDGEELFGFADRSKDEATLRELEEALARGLYSLRQLSVWTRMSLSKRSFEKMSGVVGVPADMVLEASAAALQDGIETARQSIASKGTPPSREDRRAAAVVDQCPKVYAVRRGRTAPEWARDEYLGSSKREEKRRDESTLFVRFVKAVFKVLGIHRRVDSALRVWRDLDEMSQVSRL